MENQERIIKNAQYRKGLSIAFFNATNVAVELVKVLYPTASPEEIREHLVATRDWLLEEHKNYYAEVIENIGANYNVEETTKLLKSAKNLAGLKEIWLLLSEDERRDDAVIKVAQELKAKLK